MPRKNTKRIKSQDYDLNSSKKQLNFFDNNLSVNEAKIQQQHQQYEESEEEIKKHELFEEKFHQHLENAIEKSTQTRISALNGICEILMHRYVPELLQDQKFTITNIIEKSLRKGKNQELIWSAHLATLLQVQLGLELSLFKDFNSNLINLIQNTAIPFEVRTKCCTTLSFLNFFGDNDLPDVLEIMKQLVKIFSISFVLDDEKSENFISTENSILHSEALKAWSLLLTMFSSHDIENFMLYNKCEIIPNVEQFIILLESEYLDIRMAAGEAIALLYEKTKEINEKFQIFTNNSLDNLIDVIKDLATDSNKYRAKKDRKTQRAIFRDLLKYFEDGIEPQLKIRFGTENLILNSWTLQHQYTALCYITGPGMTSHLQQNEFVRDILKIESNTEVCDDQLGMTSKEKSLEKRLVNAAAFKARTIIRAKERDYRHSAIF